MSLPTPKTQTVKRYVFVTEVECLQCMEWFRAKREDMPGRFCSEGCRSKFMWAWKKQGGDFK